ncbi:MAG: hypothetical protein JWN93_1598 [Hyphomicrobiales bacterium]|nr:hypothetical protein [Hyphomicrobiales bacterium]
MTLRNLGASPRNGWRVSAGQVDLTRASAQPRPVSVPAGARALTLDMARTAVVVVDMQNDFCHRDGWLAHIGVDVTPARAPIEPLRALLPDLRKAGVPVIWLNWGNRPDLLNIPPSVVHIYKPTGEGVGLGDPLPKNGSPVLELGSWAAAIVDELAVEPGDVQVAKYRFSGFQDTMLDSILRNLNVTTLLFTGVNADQCVMCTLQDASFLGYDCVLVEDCTATTSPDFCMQATLFNVRQCFGFVIDSKDLARAL